MANEDDKRAKQEEQNKKEGEEKRAQQAKEAQHKGPPPTQDELNDAFEGMVREAESTGKRDEPAIVRARELLNRRDGGKDASKKG